MRVLFSLLVFLVISSLEAQISPFTDHDWTIEKIVNSNGTTIMADQLPDGNFDNMYIWYQDFIYESYSYLISGCEGFFDFNDSNQSFEIFFYSCIITPNHSVIANHYVNVFILQEGGLTVTENGDVYGPFSYDFTYSDNLVYLHITNLAGSTATFYANNLSQQDFLEEQIAIYPNPIKNRLFIENSVIGLNNVSIYDINGKLVIEYQKLENDVLDVSQLESGIYILRLETSFGILEKKLVKQ